MLPVSRVQKARLPWLTVAGLLVGCSAAPAPAQNPVVAARTGETIDETLPQQAATTATAAARDGDASPAPLEATHPEGSIGKAGPVALLATSPAGNWIAVCEASQDLNGDGKLAVNLSQHGEFEGDPLRQVLYLASKAEPIDEFAGADPSGRHVAFVRAGVIHLLDTVTSDTWRLRDADVRATRASFQALRSLTFSDDGKRLAYVRGESSPVLVVHDLVRHTETPYEFANGSPYRIRFAAGGRYLLIDVPLRDTNKNGRLDWLHPIRKGPAPCPSPVPNYSVWQFPGDDPDTLLLDAQSGKLLQPEGFVLAAGNVIVRRSEDQGLLAEQPGKAPWLVSSPECLGRVLHLDPQTGAMIYGCSGAWGQRRDLFLRTPEARVQLGFDVAAFELDGLLPTREPILAFYPGNQSVLYNVRTRERWPLTDGTQVLALRGSTALVENDGKVALLALNPDASTTPLTLPVLRAPFSVVLRQGPFVAIGAQLFDLSTRAHLGEFPGATPLALSHGGEGLFGVQTATPTRLGQGPLRWQHARVTTR